MVLEGLGLKVWRMRHGRGVEECTVRGLIEVLVELENIVTCDSTVITD